MYLRFVIISLCLLPSVVTLGSATKNNQYYYKQFQEAFENVVKDYVQEPDKQKITDAAISGLLTSLDPHSNYYTDEEYEDFHNQIKGEFGGIGVEVIYENGAVKVISPIDDLPADKAGIAAGDYIVSVNDELVSNLGFNKAIKEMRGEPGTKVKLLVVKEDEVTPREVTLTREVVKIKPVKSHLEEGNIAYVRIVTFNKHTITELKENFKNLKASSSDNIRGIILDLRNNPGGLLEQAVAVSEYFIDSGVIVSTKGRSENSKNLIVASRFATKAPSVPVVVLINSGSASASEIVAGALQDYKRAIILGTKSFGKGSVQTAVAMNTRPKAEIKITTAKYYTPNGRSIQAEGIEPDIIVEQAKVEYNSKGEEKRFSEASLKNYLKNDTKNSSAKQNSDNNPKKTDQKLERDKNYKPSELYKKDYQFARAYDLIRGLVFSQSM